MSEVVHSSGKGLAGDLGLGLFSFLLGVEVLDDATQCVPMLSLSACPLVSCGSGCLVAFFTFCSRIFLWRKSSCFTQYYHFLNSPRNKILH